MALFVSQLFLLLQRVLPKRLLTALVHRLAQIRQPAVKDWFIRGFLKLYDVNLDEVSKAVPGDFVSFNDFFTRELSTGSRPIDTSPSSIVAPADGFISAIGSIDENAIFQAKGLEYSIEDLLATDLDDARSYHNGSFATIYLAPFNYHRVHAPLAGNLIAARFVPGTLFSVNQIMVSKLRGIFTRNERLVCHISTGNGRYVLIFVGALNVGSITTPWTGQLRPRKGSVVDNIDLQSSNLSTAVDKGDLLGWFNMGSTVIVLTQRKIYEWQSGLKSGDTVRMGESIGRITT